jgi:hypothetical protein
VTPEPTDEPTAEPTDEASPAPTDDAGNEDEMENGPDILPLALLTIGAAGIAAVVLLIGYLVRRAIGYDPHRPGPEGPAADEHH